MDWWRGRAASGADAAAAVSACQGAGGRQRSLRMRWEAATKKTTCFDQNLRELVTAHRVCEDCWFGHFVPGADHRCPGCETGTPLPAAPPARSVEVYDEVL